MSTEEYKAHCKINGELPTVQARLPWIVFKTSTKTGSTKSYSSPARILRKAALSSGLTTTGTRIGLTDPGREAQFGNHFVPNEFVANGIDVQEIDGSIWIFVNAHEYMNFPNQLSVLNVNGNCVSEYWNAGQISDWAFVPDEKTKSMKIILGAQNQEFGKPALIILDSRNVRGCSPQTPAFEFKEAGPGSEIFYMLLPLSPIDELQNAGVAIPQIEILDGRYIKAYSGQFSMIQYLFDLNQVGNPIIELSNLFKENYSRALREKTIDQASDPTRILEKLREGVLFHDGKTRTWANAPRSLESLARTGAPPFFPRPQRLILPRIERQKNGPRAAGPARRRNGRRM